MTGFTPQPLTFHHLHPLAFGHSWPLCRHTRHVEEEFPTVIRLSSVLAADPQPREQLPGTIQERLTGRSPMRWADDHKPQTGFEAQTAWQS